MKLIYRIIIRLSLLLSIVLTVWAAFFYLAVMDEINDEVDDALEDYSEQIIIRSLAGEELPSKNLNSNNQHYLSEVSAEYALSRPQITYVDSMVYIPHKRETEPARILTTIYKDNEGQYYELVVLTPTIEKKDLKEAILFWIVFLYLGLLLTILLVNVWIFHNSYRPLHKLLAWLDSYRVGGTNEPLDNDTEIIEFQKLNEAAVRNMKRAEEVFDEQKQFIGNASHEIQTPLAICRNRIENLMEDDSFSEEQLVELAKTHQTLEYITKLNKSLLLLSKIDNRQFTDLIDVDLNQLLKKIISDYQEAYAYLNIRVNISENGRFNVCMNETLARVLVNNLVKNSFVHNHPDGIVFVELSTDKLVIRNTGRNCPLDNCRLFERFYQGSKKEGSTGLGLALAKSISETAHLKLHYYFQDDLHCFELMSR